MDIFVYGLIVLLVFMLIIALLAWQKFFTIQSAKRKKRKKLQQYFESFKNNLVNAQKIMEYDKILGACLHIAGHEGSVGKMMKEYRGFRDENAIWSAHKLRNAIAHEMGYIPDIKTLQAAEKAYLLEIYALIL